MLELSISHASELASVVDRAIEQTGGSIGAQLAIHVERKTEEAFEGTVMINRAQTAGLPLAGRSMSWKLSLDLDGVRALCAWARKKHAAARATFGTWAAATGAAIGVHAKTLLAVLEAKAVCVRVNRSPPMTERGEPPMGQPSIVLEFDADGLAFESYLRLVYTDESDHQKVLEDMVHAGRNLATALEARYEESG